MADENEDSGSQMIEANTNFNFWEVNYYRATVKRMEDGSKLCDDFMKMLNERADIETAYYTKMKGWNIIFYVR